MTRRPSSQRAAAAIVASAVCMSAPAFACWEDAAKRYGVSRDLLYAIAQTESGLDPRAVGRNRDGSRDLGLMQINSAWLPRLAAYGITEPDLFDACTNIHVGAWVLALNVARYGYTWEAVGAYNAASPHLRQAYAAKVRRNLSSAAPSTNAPSRFSAATRTPSGSTAAAP